MTTTLPTPATDGTADVADHAVTAAPTTASTDSPVTRRPAPSAAVEPPPVDAADRALVERARTSADTLTGLIATGMLAAVARPDRLPELLYPHLPADQVRAIWDTALAVGYHAGRTAGRRAWDPADLDHARAALADAGYHALATTVEQAAYAAPSRRPPAPAAVATAHPADDDTPRTHP